MKLLVDLTDSHDVRMPGTFVSTLLTQFQKGRRMGAPAPGNDLKKAHSSTSAME